MKLRWIIVLLLVCVTCRLQAQNNPDVVAYINTYRVMAIEEMQRTGLPASIILAQGIHETEAGTSDLVRRSNNHFGIKCKDTWTGAVVYHDDDARGECFRSYTSPLDSYRDHSDFLRNSARYQSLFKLDPLNYEGWAYGLKKAGYATNNKYPQILIKLVQDYNLQQYSLVALGRQEPDGDLLAAMNPASASSTAGIATQQAGQKGELILPPAPAYPSGQFTINNTKVLFAHSGTALLAIADQIDLSMSRLADFNDLKGEEVLTQDQLIYLQRKRKQGAVEFHLVQPGETIYTISQSEGVRMESLLEMNLLSRGEEPATGEKIYLQKKATVKPAVAGAIIYKN